MKKYLLYVLVVTSLAGCASQTFEVKDEPQYDPNLHARIRVQAINKLIYGKTCESRFLTLRSVMYDESEKQITMPGMPINYKSKRIGMPFDAGKQRRIFHEIVIDVGKPVTLVGSIAQAVAGGHTVCGPVITKFIPEAGKDYDAMMHLEGRRCYIAVDNLVVKDGRVLAIPVKTESPMETSLLSTPEYCAGLVTGPKKERNEYD